MAHTPAPDHRALPAEGGTHPDTARLPLAVDLDGTLIRSDVFVEQLIGCLLQLKTLGALLRHAVRGKAALKSYVGAAAAFDPSTLPYRTDVVDWLRRERARGRPVVLATAADQRPATAIADHVGCFDDVLASDGSVNVKGPTKRKRLVERFGERGFVYVGNARADLAVWEGAAGAALVNTPPRVAQSVARRLPVEATFTDSGRSRVRAALRLLRPPQWIKNVLVFVPLISARSFSAMEGWRNAALTFLAFSALASAGYVVNDLLDLQSDRAHPVKRKRPLAAGSLPVALAAGLALSLAPVGLALAYLAGALGWGGAYLLLTGTYSTYLKHLQIVDVFTLALLYTLRVVAGGAASGHEVSTWLLAFSGFVFLALGVMKRVAELRARIRDRGVPDRGRAYETGDVGFLEVFGVAASMTSAVVMTLYVQGQIGTPGVRSPILLLFVVPAILLWQARLWLATWRGYMLEDPITYAARDWVTQVAAVVIAALFVLSSWL